MYRRKIQKVGGTTYTISLPKNWIEKNGLKEKQEIILNEGRDGKLIISPILEPETRFTEISLDIDDYLDIADTILRTLFYLGFESITLYSKSKIRSETRTKIRKALSKLSGVEIIYEDESKISLRVLLDKSKLSITQLLFRIGLVLDSSLSIISGNLDLNAIKLSENEIDRLYSLTTKVILVSLSDPETLESSNIKDVAYIPSYFLISKKMENIGDIISDIAECGLPKSDDLIKMVEIISFFRKELKRSVDHILKGYPRIFVKADDSDLAKIKEMIFSIEEKTLQNYLRDILRYIIDIEKQIIAISFYAHMGRKKR